MLFVLFFFSSRGRHTSCAFVTGSDVCSSDFLVEGIGTLGWAGPSPRWPVSFTADYVKNLGAAVSGDTAFNLELAAGRTAEPGDWRLSYNYSDRKSVV